MVGSAPSSAALPPDVPRALSSVVGVVSADEPPESVVPPTVGVLASVLPPASDPGLVAATPPSSSELPSELPSSVDPPPSPPAVPASSPELPASPESPSSSAGRTWPATGVTRSTAGR